MTGCHLLLLLSALKGYIHFVILLHILNILILIFKKYNILNSKIYNDYILFISMLKISSIILKKAQ